ncbi:hypothetical protein ADUPG1_003147, partial [Aduncisulcus paluster]
MFGCTDPWLTVLSVAFQLSQSSSALIHYFSSLASVASLRSEASFALILALLRDPVILQSFGFFFIEVGVYNSSSSSLSTTGFFLALTFGFLRRVFRVLLPPLFEVTPVSSH